MQFVFSVRGFELGVTSRQSLSGSNLDIRH
jgi:hypothetical protein